MDKGGLQCAVVNIYCTLRVVNNCISFIEINNLLCLNCQYAPQNTRTYFARLQKRRFLCVGVYCKRCGFIILVISIFTKISWIFCNLQISPINIAWENSRHLAKLPLVSPPNDVWEMITEIPYWWCITTHIWVVLLIGWIKFPTRHDQSKALPRSGWRCVISMEFLRLFLRRHLVGKPVVASPDVGCFLRLCLIQH